MNALYQLTAPHFCAGFVTRRYIVDHAAPILSYMVGWTLGEVASYAGKKAWSLLLVKEEK